MAKPHRKLPELSAQDIERFWSKIQVGPSTECWPWLGAKDEDGYALFKIKGKMYRASRLMYLLHYGEDPGPKLVCHHCDNPPCMNPADFFLGTSQDNKLDSKTKDRLNIASGDNNGSRKHPEKLQRGDDHWTHRNPELRKQRARNGAALSKEKVIAIRKSYANGQASMQDLAREHSVCVGTIHKAITRITWKHV